MYVCTYFNLPLHGDAKEHDEVHYKYRPEYWHIEGIKKCANHGDDDAFCRWMPEKKSKHTESKCYLKQQEQGVHVQPCTEEQDYVSYKEKENVCI